MRLIPDLRPRRWQVQALELWSTGFRGIARVVTGGGKTVFAYLCIEDFLRKAPEGRVQIIVPTIALLDQWFLDICASTDLEEADVACYSGEEKPERPGRINILVLNTARRVAPELTADAEVPVMLVVDECHRAGSPENSLALEGKYAATLGLSATPERDSDEGLDEVLVPALGPVFFEYDYADAHKDGVIVDFELVNVDISADPDDILVGTSLGAELDHLTGMASQGSRAVGIEKSLRSRATLSAQAALRVPWAAKLVIAHREERVIVFHERVESLARIVDLLASYGQNAVAYHSRLSESHRRDNLRLFRSGAVNVIVTCRALDEGANVPEANIAIVARSTSSTRQRIQRLGRVLRPAAGKDVATVYTLYAGKVERALLEEEEQQLEGVARITWKRGAVQ